MGIFNASANCLRSGGWNCALRQRRFDLRAERFRGTAELHAMALQPDDAFLAHDFGFMAEAIDNRAERARADFVRQARAERFHLQARRQRLGPVMLLECVERETLQRVPPGARGERFFVAD